MSTKNMNAKKSSPTVQIDGGLLVGLDEDSVFKFYGIPYAQPPVAQCRWRAPRPLKCSKGIIKAHQFAPMAYQVRLSAPPRLEPDLREKNLTLQFNVLFLPKFK